METDGYDVKIVSFHQPSLDEIAKVLQHGLCKNFGDVEVGVVDCPDLTKSPFNLAAPGLCGKPRVSDIGGTPYMFPLPQFEKKYHLPTIARQAGVPDALMIGAGAGPWQVIGSNSEMMANLKVDGEKLHINTHICKVDTEAKTYKLLKLDDCCDGGILLNLFICEGKPGKVLEVKATKRTGELNFMRCMRETLATHYGDKPVALGGTFCVKEGKCKLHVMSDFSKQPLLTEEDVGRWLRFYEMDAPLTALGYLVSHDPGLDLRMEHFHCFSSHGDGGHYHYDTTPDTVQYHGYFNVAEQMVRVDPPAHTNQLGRD